MRKPQRVGPRARKLPAAAPAKTTDTTSPTAARGGAWPILVVLGALVTLAFITRIAFAWPVVFPAPGQVRLFDTDPYYHTRHAAFAAAHFPTLQRWDPGLYPNGQPTLYAGLFDIMIAGASLIAGAGHADDDTIQRVAAFTPPVLGALVFIALFWLTKVASGRRTGILAVVLLLVCPGTFLDRSLLGAADHHVAEVLLGLLTMLGLCRCVQSSRADEPLPWWRPAIGQALPLGLFFFTWYGAPIYLVLAAATLFVVATIELGRDGSADAVARAACRYGLGLLVFLVPVSLVAPWLVMHGGFFWKSVLATVLLAAGVPAYTKGITSLIARVQSRRSRDHASPLRWGIAIAGAVLVAALLAIATAVVPGGGRLARELGGVKSSLVMEQADVTIALFAKLGGTPGFLALGALPLALFDLWKKRDATSRIVPVLFASLIVALWIRTHDYGYAAGPCLAFLAADLLTRVWRLVPSRHTRIAGAVVVGAAVILPVWPAAATFPPVPTTVELRQFKRLGEGWVQSLRWMKANTPALVLPIDQPLPKATIPFRHPPGNYGVLAFGDFGHYIAAIAARPPTSSGGISVSTARWFLLTDEEEAVRALGTGLRDGEHIRYCIADAQTAGDFFQAAIQMAGASLDDYLSFITPKEMPGARLRVFGTLYAKSMAARLYVDDGDDLSHFRMVWASPERSVLAYRARPDGSDAARTTSVVADAREEQEWRHAFQRGAPISTGDALIYEGSVGPSVKIFEQVPGAHIKGVATPGVLVEARLTLHAVTSAHTIRYHRATTADRAGGFELIVPYPTERESEKRGGTDILPNGPYEIFTVGGGGDPNQPIARVEVSASDVRTAGTIDAR